MEKADKGASYAQVKQCSNRQGGWAEQNWETTTWSDEIVTLLKAGIATVPEPVEETPDEHLEYNGNLEFRTLDSESNETTIATPNSTSHEPTAP